MSKPRSVDPSVAYSRYLGFSLLHGSLSKLCNVFLASKAVHSKNLSKEIKMPNIETWRWIAAKNSPDFYDSAQIHKVSSKSVYGPNSGKTHGFSDPGSRPRPGSLSEVNHFVLSRSLSTHPSNLFELSCS